MTALPSSGPPLVAEPPPLLVITPEQPLSDEAAILAALVDAGCQRLHLRRPGGGYAALAQLVAALPAEHRQRCTIHGPRQWALDLGCGGYHHPQAQREAQLRSSRSWHQLHEPSEVCDYGLLSPVFPSISKPGYQPSWSLAAARSQAAQWPCPVYALGGITPDRLSAVAAAGFTGAALLGWLWQPQERAGIIARWQQMSQAWQACRA